MSAPASSGDHVVAAPPVDSRLQALFHQLNNQLGIALAHAELLEVKATDPTYRQRAEHVVNGVLEAMRTAREIRRRSEATEGV